MEFSEVTVDIVSQFEQILYKENAILDVEKRFIYSKDETEVYSCLLP